jgi:hypothetical protein
MRAKYRSEAHHHHLPADVRQAETFRREQPDRTGAVAIELMVLRPDHRRGGLPRRSAGVHGDVLADGALSTVATYMVLDVLYA